MVVRLLLGALLLCGCGPKAILVRTGDAETGLPLGGVRISTDKSDVIATTDSSGLAPYPLGPARGAVVSAARPGYFGAEWPALALSQRIGETLWVNVRLHIDLPRVLECAVIDSTTGNPYSGAVLRFAGAETTLPARAGGSWTVAGFPAGPTRIIAEGEGSVPETTEVIACGGETTDVRVVLRDTLNAGAVRGTVSDDSTGAALAGVEVHVCGTSLAAVTGPDGRYSLAMVPVGRHVMECELAGYESKTIEFPLVRGWAIDVDVRLRPK